MEKYENHTIVDENIEGDDIFINGKIVDDFNTLDKKFILKLFLYIIFVLLKLLYCYYILIE